MDGFKACWLLSSVNSMNYIRTIEIGRWSAEPVTVCYHRKSMSHGV